MVESTCLKNFKASGEPLLDAELIEDQGTWSVRSAVFRDRSKSRREELTVKSLAGACMPFRESCSPRESVGSNTTDSNVFAQAASRGRIPYT